MPDDDRQMLRAILDYCAAQCQAAGRSLPTADMQARRRAYASVARAARELLEEMEG